MQALFLQALDPVAETTADPNSYGFRRERSCADAIAQGFIVLAKKYSPRWILEGDIRACFDRINHDWLLSHVPMDKEILHKWLKSGYLQSQVFYPTEEGTPQGGIISPVLANLALDGMEGLLKQNLGSTRLQASQNQVNLIRYADDFVITSRSKTLLETQVMPLIQDFLSERGLELSPEKTKITHIEDGFDFLGQNVRKYDGKLIIQPSKQNVASFLANIREVVKSHPTATAGELVRQLNPQIKGWAMYHRHICAKRTFTQVDNAIFHSLWRWAVRRHPDKSKHWISQKYFTSLPSEFGSRNWVFFGEIERGDNGPRAVTLLKASHIPIRRHVKIRMDVNPYSPEWAEYLRKRHSRERSVRHRSEEPDNQAGSVCTTKP